MSAQISTALKGELDTYMVREQRTDAGSATVSRRIQDSHTVAVSTR